MLKTLTHKDSEIKLFKSQIENKKKTAKIKLNIIQFYPTKLSFYFAKLLGD